MKKLIIITLIYLVIISACKGKDSVQQPREPEKTKPFSVLVFITGVIAGSPTYEMLAEGALEFAEENNNSEVSPPSPPLMVKIYEAGFNQAEWEEQLRSMVAGGEYDLVLGSNPSLPEICSNVGKSFPNQKFIITDAALPSGTSADANSSISAYLYNQYEQALFLGYLAGLITTSKIPHSNDAKRIGFIAAQEYPLLSRHIVPGFLDGARRVDPDIELDFRVIGNWYDANKAADLSDAMVNAGVDVFSSIAGGASQGLIRTIKERGAYMVSFNINEYSQAPGYIVGCGIMRQKKLVKEILGNVLAGKIIYGTTKTVGVKEGYLDFISDDSGYINYVPAEIRRQFESFMDDLRAGRIKYTIPNL